MTKDDEADLWQKDLSSVIEIWIDVGIPDEKLIRKACGRANQVVVYCYGGRVVDTWFTQNIVQFKRLKNLTVINLPIETTHAIAKMAQRKMQLNFTIQDGQVWLGNGDEIVMIELVTLIEPPMRR